MKKILLASMIVLGTLGLSSCGETATTETEITETEVVTPEEDATMEVDTTQTLPADSTSTN